MAWGEGEGEADRGEREGMGGKEVLHTWNVPVLSCSASSALSTYLQSDVCLVRSLSHQFIVLIDPLV